jgi:hypothetical protein
MPDNVEQNSWVDLPFECPHCGNHGAPDGAWKAKAGVPFLLIEEVYRPWPLDAEIYEGNLLIMVETVTASDWDSESDLRVRCMQCSQSFPLPEGATVEFE